MLHAPADKEVNTVDEILGYALRPGFLVYCLCVAIFAIVMIYVVAPKYGKKIPMVYVSICSTVGSISVMSIKGFGIAVKLTFQGKNQFTHLSTYVFAIVVCVCIALQLTYLNKALDQFDISIVNPLYYVTFTTFTLCASFILFAGVHESKAIDNISLVCGFLLIFVGVYILNLSREGAKYLLPQSLEGIPMDNTVASIQTRRSLQLHSTSIHRRSSSMQSQSQEALLVDELDDETMGFTRYDDSFDNTVDYEDNLSNYKNYSSHKVLASEQQSSAQRVL